jgi:hypothetical protein
VAMNINPVTFVAPNLACGEAREERVPVVGDEQRSHKPNSAQPSERQFFLAQPKIIAKVFNSQMAVFRPTVFPVFFL